MSRPPTTRDSGDRPGAPASAGDDGRCADVQRLLLEALRPGDSLDAAAEAHLQACARCRGLRDQLLVVDDAAHEAAPELPAGFELSLRRRLREHRPGRGAAPAANDRQPATVVPPRRSRTPFILAAAALVLVAAGVVTLAARWQGGGKPTFHRLHLAIQATQDCDEVMFDVDLPEGVRPLPGLPESIGRDRSLQWQSPLRAGANEFDLPLLAQHRRGEVQVRLRMGEKTWTGTVSLATSQGRADDAAPAEVRLALLVGPEGRRGGGQPW
jgi:hypothetical protein